eukprot:COSAG03_NODE_890_length_5476_cov_35.296468_4_plen_119_part_00
MVSCLLHSKTVHIIIIHHCIHYCIAWGRYPLEISHCSHDITAPVGQLTISHLQATDSLPRPFLHASAPTNTTAGAGGLREIAIDATIRGWVNATEQCTPVGIAPDEQWGVAVSVNCVE